MTVNQIIGCVLMALGVAIMVLVVWNVFQLDFVINRLHITAMADSLGTLLIFAGAALCLGRDLVNLKLILILALQWVTSPVCGHMITQMEYAVVDDLGEHTVSIRTEQEEREDV